MRVFSAVVAVLVLLVLTGFSSCQRPAPLAITPALAGSIYDPPVPASDLTLNDQTGKPYTLSSAQAAGKMVVMSFLYTHCTDTCPYVGIKLRQVLEQLGQDAKNVDIVIVSTDPEGDTPAAVAEYSKALGMYDTWHFLTGTRAQLEKVWADYHVAVGRLDKDDESNADATALGLGQVSGKTDRGSASPEPVTPKADTGLGKDDLALAANLITRFGSETYEISHSVPFWIVDRQGRIRSSFSAEALPSQIVYDVKTLLGYKNPSAKPAGSS